MEILTKMARGVCNECASETEVAPWHVTFLGGDILLCAECENKLADFTDTDNTCSCCK